MSLLLLFHGEAAAEEEVAVVVVPNPRHIRERPPLRTAIRVKTPSGNIHRWAEDEPNPANVYTDLTYGDAVPGGFDSCSVTLPRKPGVNYGDLERLSTLRIEGAGGECVGEYRLESAPRTSGDEMSVSPQAVGWQAHLDDDKSAVEVYVDTDLNHWGEVSATRKIAVRAAGLSPERNLNVEPDASTGYPKMFLGITGTFDDTEAEALYNAGPTTIANLTVGSVTRVGLSADANLTATPRSWSDDAASNEQQGTDYESASSISFSPTTPRRYIVLNWRWSGAGPAGADSIDYGFRYGALAVFGNHGLTKQGTSSATSTQGLYAADVIANAVSRWAPLLNYTTGIDGSIKPSAFVIPQLEFRESTTTAEIIKAANRFHLRDWAVWEGESIAQPTFYYRERGDGARSWRARVAPAKLQETGPQVERLWSGVVVKFKDVDGSTKTVGPTGAATDANDEVLLDDDPLNPANQLGIRRWALLDMQIVSTTAAATEVGRRFLEESKLLDSSGKATLVGHVLDDKGILHPYSHVRSGDTISFVDASDSSERRIVKTQKSRRANACDIDLDAPPQGLEALLERLGVVLIPLGL